MVQYPRSDTPHVLTISLLRWASWGALSLCLGTALPEALCCEPGSISLNRLLAMSTPDSLCHHCVPLCSGRDLPWPFAACPSHPPQPLHQPWPSSPARTHSSPVWGRVTLGRTCRLQTGPDPSHPTSTGHGLCLKLLTLPLLPTCHQTPWSPNSLLVC